mmetsp:Transcript_50236/g.119935  ORF Transcript_50236/g.119935 Transcript_50236/m.119935 type:complete len:88 (+) Transcript_50236:80-343(+)
MCRCGGSYFQPTAVGKEMSIIQSEDRRQLRQQPPIRLFNPASTTIACFVAAPSGAAATMARMDQDVNAGAEAMDARIDNFLRSCVVQ